MIKLKHTAQSTCRATSQLAAQNLTKVVRHIELLTFNWNRKIFRGCFHSFHILCLNESTSCPLCKDFLQKQNLQNMPLPLHLTKQVMKEILMMNTITMHQWVKQKMINTTKQLQTLILQLLIEHHRSIPIKKI